MHHFVVTWSVVIGTAAYRCYCSLLSRKCNTGFMKHMHFYWSYNKTRYWIWTMMRLCTRFDTSPSVIRLVWHPFSVSPSLSVLSCPFECNIAIIILSNHVAFEFFFSLLLVYLSFCLQSFHAKVHRVSKHGDVSFAKWSSSICLSSFSLLRTSSLVTLSSQLIFSILLHIHISKASNLLSVCINVHVSAAYSATLQTKHFIILFFSSRFTLPVNNFSFSINTFFNV